MTIIMKQETLQIVQSTPTVTAHFVKEHITNNDVHITVSDRENWNNKQDESVEVDLAQYFKDKLQ